MKMTLVIILLITSSITYAQSCNTTPTQCYEIEQQRKAEAIRLKQEKAEATYRQQQLELQNAQLRELQEQRAIQEEELASQQRMEEIKMREMEEAERANRLKTNTNEKN